MIWLRRPATAAFATIGLGVVMVAGTGGAFASPPGPGSAAGSARVVPASAGRLPAHVTRAGCDLVVRTGQLSCPLLLRAVAGDRAAATSAPAGYGPADLQSAYNLSAAAADGSGVTVAVVTPGDDPNAAADLAAYRTQYGLPSCTESSGCFSVVNQNGAASPLPVPSASWATDDSVVLDMVSATCPNCHIVLVEATGINGVLTAEASAISVVHANVIVDGWHVGGVVGGGYDGELGQHFDHPGVAIVAPAGDSGKSLAGWTVSANGTVRSGHLCLTAVKGTAGSPLQLARCGPSSSQRWQLVPGYVGSSQIQALPSGLCVILPSAGAAITLGPCYTGAGIEVTGEWWRIQ